jgi:hypothetical protein
MRPPETKPACMACRPSSHQGLVSAEPHIAEHERLMAGSIGQLGSAQITHSGVYHLVAI